MSVSRPMALTVKEASKAIGVSEYTVRWMCYKGTLPHNRTQARGKKGQGRILISRAALEEWLRGNDFSKSMS